MHVAPLPVAGTGSDARLAALADDERLCAACAERAAETRGRLGAGCAAIEHAPFVVAGDLSVDELERWHRRTIGPATRAMFHAYFRAVPDEPIVVLLFSCEETYTRYARQLFNEEGISVYGYYKPRERTLVMNIGTGGGTLVHELTHALIARDFPEVPDWFNEGLASLHEACRIRADETGLDGVPNWRLPVLRKAIEAGTLPPLRQLVSATNFRGEHEGRNYAQARYLCLFLQRRRVLGRYYAELRANHARDPNGAATLLAMFPDKSWDDLDAEFVAWVATLTPP